MRGHPCVFPVSHYTPFLPNISFKGTGTTMAIDWYKEFVNLNYEPAKDDLVCLFYFEPAAGISGREAAGRIASESSTGTWTTLFTMPPRMKALQATAFDIERNVVKIAYPLDIWEEGNAVQL